VTALKVQNVSLNFGGLRALDNVSFEVEFGERHLIIGPNGAGKTTLFNMLSGIYSSSSGEILIDGRSCSKLSVHERAQLGLARTFQLINLFHNLSVLDNVLLALQAVYFKRGLSLFRPMEHYRDIYDMAESLMNFWGLSKRANDPVNVLSYGEQRQLDLAIAMAGKPKLLLLDEPLAGLSPAEASRVVEVIRRLPRETTLILIEHDMDLALGLADGITVLHQGRVIANGSREEIQGHPLVNEIYLGVEA